MLRLAAAEPADRPLLEQLARDWSARSGAEVHVLDGTWDGNADIGMIPVAELGRWAEAGQLAEAPISLKQPTHSYRWEDLLRPYSDRLTNWQDRTYALPVIAEGMVVVYRKDLFDGKEGRPPAPPSDWDDFLDYQPAFGNAYLPPLPRDPERLGAEFFSAAACYDRLAVGRINAEDLIRDSGRFFAFQFDPDTGNPRLDAKSFQHVAKLFNRMTPIRCKAADGAEAFRSGQAKVGILSLAELARIAPEMEDKLAVAPLPGARSTFDADGQERLNDQQAVNRIPYLGWGGRLGVVSAKCTTPAAAWDFLIDAGLPERSALDLIANARLGAGPYRASQLEGRARPRWFGYGLSTAETDRLIAALRENLGPGVQNYRFRLRTPNQRELSAALDEELRMPQIDMNKANRRWEDIIRKQPASEWRTVARKSLGLK